MVRQSSCSWAFAHSHQSQVRSSDGSKKRFLPVIAECPFSTLTTYSTGTGSFPRSVVTADLNSDGRLDIIFTNSAADNATVLFNSGGSAFNLQATKLTDGGFSPYSVAVADINGDGKVDIMVANYDADSIGILVNRGDGKFSAQMNYPMHTGSSPRSVAAVDVNGDGST